MLIRCKTGGEIVDVPGGEDAHSFLDRTGCSHCADGHDLSVHCGQAANACYEARVNGTPLHDGPCWNPPEVPERPSGCTVCRPVIFMGNFMLPGQPEG